LRNRAPSSPGDDKKIKTSRPGKKKQDYGKRESSACSKGWGAEGCDLLELGPIKNLRENEGRDKK